MSDEFLSISESNPVVEHFPLQLDGLLYRTLQSHNEVEITGGHNPLAFSLFVGRSHAKLNAEKPQLIIVSDAKAAQQLASQMQFFDPHVRCFVLPSFDVDPYSNLYPKHQLIAQRVAWSFHAQNAQPGQIFIAPIMALLQRTIPKELLNINSHIFGKNSDLPNQLAAFLTHLGYTATPVVEDVGSFCLRGGIVDIFSPAHSRPIRIELFGDTIDTLRFFDPVTQRSQSEADEFLLIPAREILFSDKTKQRALSEYNSYRSSKNIDPEEAQHISRSITQSHYFHGVDFLLSYFYESSQTPLDHFSTAINAFYFDPLEIARENDTQISKLKIEFEKDSNAAIHPDYKTLYTRFEDHQLPDHSKKVLLTKVHIADSSKSNTEVIHWPQADLTEVQSQLTNNLKETTVYDKILKEKLDLWRSSKSAIFIACHNQTNAKRIELHLNKVGYQAKHIHENAYSWNEWIHDQQQHPELIHIIQRPATASVRLNQEAIVVLRDEDFFGKKHRRKSYETSGSLQKRTKALSFGDLKLKDLIVHKMHGVGRYLGLKVMSIQGIDSEFVELEYKGKDKLYLPIYRIGQIQKFSGPQSESLLDKLGGTSWAKTQTKVRAHVHDVASELLKLYAIRSQIKKTPFSPPKDEYEAFTESFPFDETEDQLNAINDVLTDMTSDKPMDRLVCGDVGFGKTEVALRAAFKAIEDGKQVALIAPTTILTFQHEQTFKKRFNGWPVTIKALNRLVPKSKQKDIVEDLKTGKVDIVIGTHRLFSKDIDFNKLGLLIIDEEQKFGVKHKEKIRRLKQSVDTLTLSATPIPRTLNMSLMGLRDLSIINTPPVDRLPTRTFVTKFDPETIKKAVTSEISRGGQVFFLHNRVQSIYALEDELRSILPDVRMSVAHGQMDESQLESTMMKFFNHEIDMLICTTIIESGMDIPKANTMFIDKAHQLGLSQLYQLRGRVGRSKTRAYCYLLVPRNKQLDGIAQERLRVIQENTALGSGIQIAQHDLELRGSGDILGEDQSGNINAVGYELYLELLEEEISKLKGEELKEDIEPEINLKIPALIPDKYISDIRIRLAYYKALSDISSPEELDHIEEELRDQFGKPPEPVINLMGLMLIRKLCKDLSIKDITAGKAGISLILTDNTKLPIDKLLKLTQRSDKKYSIAPDNRLTIRMREVTWPRVYEELEFLNRGL